MCNFAARACSMNASDIWNEHGTLHSSVEANLRSRSTTFHFSRESNSTLKHSELSSDWSGLLSAFPHIRLQLAWKDASIRLLASLGVIVHSPARLQTFEAEQFSFRKWHIPSAKRAHHLRKPNACANRKISKIFDSLVKIDFQLKIDTVFLLLRSKHRRQTPATPCSFCRFCRFQVCNSIDAFISVLFGRVFLPF